MGSPRLGAVAAFALGSLAAAVGARAQEDRRDVVTLKEGPPLRCRVFARFEPDVVTVQVGEQRRDVPVADIVAMDTVRDRVREFFERIDGLPGNLKNRWFAAEWAASRELHDLARLAALDIVLRDPDHEGAHTMLGHRRRAGQWQWPCDDGWKTFAELEKVCADWQHAWCIEGEHFRVKSDADLRRVVDAVWDLERLHLAWFDRFGEGLRLYELVGDNLQMEIWSDERRVPGQKVVPGDVARKEPFFTPNVGDLSWRLPTRPGWRTDRVVAVSRTYFAEPAAARPLRLFQVATSHLIFNTITDSPDLDTRYRPAAWIEAGLARYLERAMAGPAGSAVLGAWRVDPADARVVLAKRTHPLRDVARYDSKKLWGGVSDENVFAWPAAELAVAWMLESGSTRLREALFGYMLEVHRPVKIDSSEALDRHLGQPIETLDAPWRAWIEQRLAAPAPQVTTPRKP